jgi:hypothetical protein
VIGIGRAIRHGQIIRLISQSPDPQDHQIDRQITRSPDQQMFSS